MTTVAGIWSALAVMGIGTVFAAHPFLRMAVQVAGGLYLLHVAFRLWHSRAGDAPSAAGQLSPQAAFRLGFLTNILNPKSALFFGSVFATALPAQPSMALLAACVGVVLANALAWHLLLAFAFATAPVQAVYARQRTVLGRVAGLLVGAFGLRLLAATGQELRRTQ